MPDGARYLVMLLACLAVTLPLELARRAKVYRRMRRLVGTVGPVVLAFAVWDTIGIARGHWSFSSRYTVGLSVLGLPVEEWLFFVIIPICALLTYEAIGSRRRSPSMTDTRRPASADRHDR